MLLAIVFPKEVCSFVEIVYPREEDIDSNILVTKHLPKTVVRHPVELHLCRPLASAQVVVDC
jgi:hypothetical protein